MTKEQLRAYKDIKKERDQLRSVIEDLEDVMYSPRAQRLDGMPHSGSGPGSVVESVAVKHADLLEKYRRKEAELADAMAEIESAIEELEPRERTLIRLHYIKGLTWEEVAVAMTYSWRQVHRIHGKALEKLKSRKEENTPCG